MLSTQHKTWLPPQSPEFQTNEKLTLVFLQEPQQPPEFKLLPPGTEEWERELPHDGQPLQHHAVCPHSPVPTGWLQQCQGESHSPPAFLTVTIKLIIPVVSPMSGVGFLNPHTIRSQKIYSFEKISFNFPPLFFPACMFVTLETY